jgi:hypothetical protein
MPDARRVMEKFPTEHIWLVPVDQRTCPEWADVAR